MEVDDQWSSTSGLPHPWPSVYPNPSPVLEWITGNRHNSSQQNPHIGSLTCGVRAIMMEKAKQKPLELSLQKKRVSQRVLQSWEDCGDDHHHQEQERFRGGDSQRIPIQLTY